METLLGLGVVLAGGALVTQSAFLRARPLLALGLVVVSSTAIWHAIVDYGFINDHYGRATVASRYEQYNIPLMDIASLNTMIGQADVSIIDARRSKDYVREHLPNAVSVPVSATQGQLREALAAIPKSNRVVVYCQSNRCVWSDAIAQQLAANGYDNVWVYRDGMNGWRQKLDTADSQSQEDE
jgi:rhodanese-related sulfurtransferase